MSLCAIGLEPEAGVGSFATAAKANMCDGISAVLVIPGTADCPDCACLRAFPGFLRPFYGKIDAAPLRRTSSRAPGGFR
jgi:hypothetical protein